MPARLKALPRAVATVLVLALALVSLAQCLAAAETAERHACCAGMRGNCEMAVTASCCATEAADAQGFVATKPTIAPPAATLLAVLALPGPALHESPRRLSGRASSVLSPPGVPTYLFVSSFRI